MQSIAFPKMFGIGQTNIVEDHEASVQNLKLLLTSEKGELFCDPYFGDNLKRFFYEKGNVFLKDIIIDDIFVAINTFMPQLVVTRKDIQIKIKKNDVYCTIAGLNNLSTSPSVLEINLTQFDNEE